MKLSEFQLRVADGGGKYIDLGTEPFILVQHEYLSILLQHADMHPSKPAPYNSKYPLSLIVNGYNAHPSHLQPALRHAVVSLGTPGIITSKSDSRETSTGMY